jgi:hypothetical protein
VGRERRGGDRASAELAIDGENKIGDVDSLSCARWSLGLLR